MWLNGTQSVGIREYGSMSHNWVINDGMSKVNLIFRLRGARLAKIVIPIVHVHEN